MKTQGIFLIKCAYCEIYLNAKDVTKDHIIPKSKGGKYGKNGKNIVLCCSGCNLIKSNMTIWKFVRHISKEYKKLSLGTERDKFITIRNNSLLIAKKKHWQKEIKFTLKILREAKKLEKIYVNNI